MASEHSRLPFSYDYGDQKLLKAIKQDIIMRVGEPTDPARYEKIKEFVSRLSGLSRGITSESHEWPGAELYYLFDIINGAINVIYEIEHQTGKDRGEYTLPFYTRTMDYWKNPATLPAECFASFGCVSAAVEKEQPKKFEYIKTYLPTAYNLYNNEIITAAST